MGTATGQFRRPLGIAFNPGGHLYVAENSNVQKFNPIIETICFNLAILDQKLVN